MRDTSKIIDKNKINFDKLGGLIPACIQDVNTGQVLMLGFMNKAALEQTLATQRATFWSRSKKRLWVKGETSGNYLAVVDLHVDCDNDSLLIYAHPQGPTCHTGDISCFPSDRQTPFYWLAKLIKVIDARYSKPPKNSYTAKLFQAGIKRIAQKVGEEGVEVALAAVSDNREEVINESADLLFHLLVLLKQQGIDLSAIGDVLEDRSSE